MLTAGGTAFAAKAQVPELTEKEFKEAKNLYYDRCAGCHGAMRKGATGPKISQKKMLKKSLAKLEDIIFNGTEGGMPGWGKTGDMNKAETKLMAKYMHLPAPIPPEMGLKQMRKTHKVYVPTSKRPGTVQHKRDIMNYFGVILRDAGQGVIFDGDTKEKLATFTIGHATHIFRASATGRYFYTIGRDGKAVLIDLYYDKPKIVAEVRVCLDARSIEVSKYKGALGNFQDQLAIVGCYWPPQLVILDGLSLEPLKVISTRSYTYDTNEFVNEARVATIVASHYNPEWVVAIKETGLVWLVDYSDLQNLSMTQIATERFLHDGGWDASKRYLLIAANMRDTMVVVDTKDRKFVTKFETGIKPHPGRGANWDDPKYGRVSATTHLGEGKITVYGSDPMVRPQYAWKVLRTAKTGGNGLFLKTHPASNNVWTDATIAKDKDASQSICVFYKDAFGKKPNKCWKATNHGKIVHFEYNKDGSEVWVSVWDTKGEMLIYDDKTLKLKHRITGLDTPTGKWNMYNTVNDVF
ncbi:MAG: nitrite reductase [SAR324 cluster bacterium]|uniref:Nitrite reductase n=1 Tax=SAR324 cluster bacterium TaxID=2024889 RepID=A0A2A4TB73_9DELT|nr:MAG: nitrite reductase [SAR324 cluster bacterium]